jgi:hypothetical protein
MDFGVGTGWSLFKIKFQKRRFTKWRATKLNKNNVIISSNISINYSLDNELKVRNILNIVFFNVRNV